MLHPTSVQKLHELDEGTGRLAVACLDHLDLTGRYACPRGKGGLSVSGSFADGLEGCGGHLAMMANVAPATTPTNKPKKTIAGTRPLRSGIVVLHPILDFIVCIGRVSAMAFAFGAGRFVQAVPQVWNALQQPPFATASLTFNINNHWMRPFSMVCSRRSMLLCSQTFGSPSVGSGLHQQDTDASWSRKSPSGTTWIASGKEKILFLVNVAEPARGRIVAGQIGERCPLGISKRIETEASIRGLTLIHTSVLDEDATCEGRKLNKHGSLLVDWAELPTAVSCRRFHAPLMANNVRAVNSESAAKANFSSNQQGG